MNCLEYRRIRLADPYTQTPALSAHKSECESCQKFDMNIRQFDEDLHQALKIDVPEGLAARILLNQSLQAKAPRRRIWMSLAASFLIAATLALYQLFLPASIDAKLVTHVEEEQHVVLARSNLLEEAQIKQVLNSIKLDLDGSFGKVTFAANCLIDGKMVGHFVVEQGSASYTLFVIPDQNSDRLIKFKIDSWHGITSPHQSGSLLAILSNNQSPDDDKVMMSIVSRVSSVVDPLKV